MRFRPAIAAAGFVLVLPSSASARPAVSGNDAPPPASLQSLAVSASAVDRDGDGIPARWETLHGTSDNDPADALLDFDGDGLDNFAEFLTGGLPWGQYELFRCPLDRLPGTIAWAEFIAANRPGEFLFNITTGDSTLTYLWKPIGEPAPGITLLPEPLPPGVFLNDNGKILHNGTVRNIRDWNAKPEMPFSRHGETPVAITNEGTVLVAREFSAGSSFPWRWVNYQWLGSGWQSENFSIPLRPDAVTLAPVVDPGSGAWFLSSSGFSRVREPLPQSGAWLLAGSAPIFVTMASLPKGWTGIGFHAAAAGRAIGTALDPAGSLRTVILDERGWSTVPDAAAGPDPLLTAIDDTGLILGWELAVRPPQPFLWKERAAALATAIPEIPGSFVPAGLTRSGILYGLDFAGPVRQPVVLRRLPDSLSDAAGQAVILTLDRDGDGIPDDRESALGLRPDRLDTDGDGWADLHQLTRRPAVRRSAPAPESNPAGLVVFTPRRHPLLTAHAIP